MTTLITSLSDWQALRATLTQPIGFVPTMGNLHAGHASLLQRAKQDNAVSVLSVFVNPTQFNDTNDFDIYPRTLENDLTLAAQHKIDYVLAPNAAALYPNGFQYRVSEQALATVMEGNCRPGHFEGMLTVVLKLLLLVMPTHAYFGEKDYQQLQLVQGLVQDFFLPITIVPMPTIRAENGLALSSRNQRLTPARQAHAAHLFQTLQQATDCASAIQTLERLGFKVDYIEEHQDRRFGAVFLDGVRLIDNIPLSNVK